MNALQPQSEMRKDFLDNNPAGPLRGRTDQENRCFVCEKQIAAGDWFCRVPRLGGRVALCSSWCALRYFDNLHDIF